ncbi:unnamed protein product [Pylaiella littoralis]
MKLPDAPAPSKEFKNAIGSDIPEEFALAARKNPDAIKEMAESPSELAGLKTEALARAYTIIVDRSGSMDSPDGFGKTRWDSARKAVEKLVDTVFRYDTDGSVPLYLFDDQVEFVGECTSSSQVKGVFESYSPRGTTKLAECLEVAMKKYLPKNRDNSEVVPGSTFLILLDGSTDDNDAVKKVLHYYADPANGFIKSHTDVALSFIQIGDNGPATKFLEELDEGSPEYPDVVDTKKDNVLFEKGGVERILHDAIFD